MGKFPDPPDDLRVLTPGDGNVTILKPDGSLLVAYRPGAMSEHTARARPSLRRAASVNTNRGYAGGSDQDKVRKPQVRADGTVSKTTIAQRAVQSGTIGNMDRGARTPYCRVTSWSRDFPEHHARAMPLVQRLDEVFREAAPEAWERQRRVCEATAGTWVLPGTVFTTVSINRNFRTAAHKGKGDYAPGAGVIGALRQGEYTGGYLWWPRYGVGADLHDGDVVVCDVHEVHANTEIRGAPGSYERMSVVAFYRAGMKFCGTAQDERARAAAGERRYVT